MIDFQEKEWSNKSNAFSNALLYSPIIISTIYDGNLIKIYALHILQEWQKFERF